VPSLIQTAAVGLPADEAAAYAVHVHWIVSILRYIPYILAFVIIVYMIVSIFVKERMEYYA